jgi:hypothetical protein
VAVKETRKMMQHRRLSPAQKRTVHGLILEVELAAKITDAPIDRERWKEAAKKAREMFAIPESEDFRLFTAPVETTES